MSTIKKVVLVTSGDYRHEYFVKKFCQSKNLCIVGIYREKRKKEYSVEDYKTAKSLKEIHFIERQLVEKDFFEAYNNFSFPILATRYLEKKGDINSPEIVEEIKGLNPDYICTFGCGIIKKGLLEEFPNRIINVHLGISPYYEGSGTNFWAAHDSNLSAFGYSFQYMNSGIDTGETIHQGRCEAHLMDSVHQIGCRTIKNMVGQFVHLMENFEQVEKKERVKVEKPRICKRKDCDDTAISKTYSNFGLGLVQNYINDKEELDDMFPIVEQEWMK